MKEGLHVCEQGEVLRNCVKHGAGPGPSFFIPLSPPSLINRTVSVDVKHHEGRREQGNTGHQPLLLSKYSL